MNGYRLVQAPAVAPAGGARQAPRLDEAQQRVVDHKGGPLLVLAGPGTGKTTTIVEAVTERVDQRGVDPSRILVLTFSRKAAEELRERITARLHRTTREPLALTFHSYAYALVRREYVLAGDSEPRLLSAPEQLLEIRRLLRGEIADGAGRWPERLWPALPARGFADELRDVLMRAAERGLDGKALRRLGRTARRDDWVAAGGFLDRYAARFDLAPVPAYDYAEIVRIAASLLSRGATRERERAAYDAVFVDEYQDSDPAQESLLLALAGDGRDLIAVGDPDQSIYGFRGADVRALGNFPEKFRAPDGTPAPVVALRTCRRSGPVLLSASRRVARRLPYVLSVAPHELAPHEPATAAHVPPQAAPGLLDAEPPEPARPPGPAPEPAPRLPPVFGNVPHRALLPVPDAPAGEIRILIADTATQEAALVADTLRRAHLAGGLPWGKMAVLVRSAQRQVPPLRRALAAAGVPVSVSGDELPLPDEPGTRPLLTLLRCALRPDSLDDETAVDLLTGPLGGTDGLGLRKLRRTLGGQSLRTALTDAEALDLVPDRIAAPARRVAVLLARARRAIAAGGTAEDVLWSVWDASGLAERWERAAERDPSADRDLDAVLALFDRAARFADEMPPGRPQLFLDSLSGQEIVADTLAGQAVREDCVRVLTAHRSKGLEWDLVVIAGVQEETWPDLRMRGSLLGADDLAEAASPDFGGQPPDVAAAATAARLLAEERRLFYVAVTRAKKLLVVTAAGGEESAQRPSRFLAELAGDDIEIERAGAHARWLSLPVLVADLRQAAADPARPLAVREAAAGQLARLAAAGVRGADPGQWYALTPLSDDGPVVAEGEAVRLSPSQVESFARCGLRWLLEAAVGAGRSDVLQHLGIVIHAAAEEIARGASEADVTTRIDEIWHHLDFGSVWYGTRQREVAEQMVRKFLDWHAANPRALVEVEQALRVQVGQVEITGRVDRLERDELGRGVIVDLKTGSSSPRDDELDRHPQLGVYQLAVLLGAFERLGVTEPGGAELVQLGKAGFKATAKVQRQHALADDRQPDWARDLVEAVASGMAGPVFRARANPGCRTCPVASCCPVQPEGGQVGD
ncbi:MAG TPA: ATP-dependent DNA helicase [Trebonia sp.]|nr:ATP-dependent DNA helicase [Trebonia sp.]